MRHVQRQQSMCHWLLRGSSSKVTQQQGPCLSGTSVHWRLGSYRVSVLELRTSQRQPACALVIWQWDSRHGDQDKFRLLALPRCLQCLPYRLSRHLLQMSYYLHKLNVLPVHLLCLARFHKSIESWWEPLRELQCWLQYRNKQA
jgi:hypothetical protein